MVDGPDDVYVEREGRIERAPDGLFEGEAAITAAPSHLIRETSASCLSRASRCNPYPTVCYELATNHRGGLVHASKALTRAVVGVVLAA
jgi:hypothetical protein